MTPTAQLPSTETWYEIESCAADSDDWYHTAHSFDTPESAGIQLRRLQQDSDVQLYRVVRVTMTREPLAQ